MRYFRQGECSLERTGKYVEVLRMVEKTKWLGWKLCHQEGEMRKVFDVMDLGET